MQAMYFDELAVEGAEYVAYADFSGWSREAVSAAVTPLTADEAGAAQFADNFPDERAGHILIINNSVDSDEFRVASRESE